jgi:hypothetical protein
MSDECNIARRHFNKVDKLRHDNDDDDDDDELQFIAFIRHSHTYMLLAKRNGKCKQGRTF